MAWHKLECIVASAQDLVTQSTPGPMRLDNLLVLTDLRITEIVILTHVELVARQKGD